MPVVWCDLFRIHVRVCKFRVGVEAAQLHGLTVTEVDELGDLYQPVRHDLGRHNH